MPSVLIRMLTVWHILFWLNVFWSECLDSLTTLLMLMYQGRMKEMDGRRLCTLLICWLSQDMEFRNIKTHVG